MRYLESGSTDPYYNLALEQVVFDGPGQDTACCMLWQNDNTIVVGKHQNTLQEVNMAYVREHNVRVARRLSGGGAVYHDLGNVNFTFIAPHEGGGMDFSTFCRPVAAALAELGVQAELSGRNDMTIDGKKFSGNSQYVKRGRVMHHGTILYDSDLSVVGQALRVPEDKFTSKGLPSVRSRVTNIKPYMHQPMPTESFMERLWSCLGEVCDLVPYELDRGDLNQVERIRQAVYDRWEWNYGSSPRCQIDKRRRVEGCGEIRVCLDLKEGAIQALSFYGDFFSRKEPDQLARRLIGCPLREEALRATVPAGEIGQYFQNMDLDEFCGLMLC